MPPLHRPVLTQQTRAPWSWVVLINLAWFGSLYNLFVTSVALPLTLVRFTDDTRLIAFVTSIGGIMGIVIGPAVNYISDRLWSRFGRRRPFLLVATLGTCVAMGLTPFMPALVPLVMLVVIGSLLGDVGSTFEPLWLEIVPPGQRGRAFVMRNVATQLASLYFFQIMFAQWDNRYAFDLSSVGLGTLRMNGEQLTYLVASLLSLYTIAFLSFLVREVRPAGVTLRPWRELDFHPWRFTRSFVRDVFGDRRWWPIYLFYVAPSLLTAGTGTFNNLMMVEQWRYEKPSIALMGFPPMIVSILVVSPLLGRQSDSFREYPLSRLLGAMAALLGVLVAVVLTVYPALGPRELPPFWALMTISLCVILGGVLATFLVVQVLNRLIPCPNPRLWPWLLVPVANLAVALATLFYVRVVHAGSVPPIAHWYFFTLLTTAVAGFTALSGPLLYEYMPKDKIGTLSSGFGMLSTAVGALMANVMGFWIFYYSRFFGSPDGKDYAASLMSVLLTGPITLALAIYFFRLARRGGLIEYGRLNLNSDGSSPLAESPAAPPPAEPARAPAAHA